MRLSYLYNGNPYTGKTASLYWDAPGWDLDLLTNGTKLLTESMLTLITIK